MSKKTKIYVCTEGKNCPKKGSKAVAAALHNAVAALSADEQERISIKECKCLDLCKKGPSVVVAPDKVRYGRVTAADASAIVNTHLSGGEPITRLQIKKKE
jgi:(2Fe-2S) ferredoxin